MNLLLIIEFETNFNKNTLLNILLFLFIKEYIPRLKIEFFIL